MNSMSYHEENTATYAQPIETGWEPSYAIYNSVTHDLRYTNYYRTPPHNMAEIYVFQLLGVPEFLLLLCLFFIVF